MGGHQEPDDHQTKVGRYRHDQTQDVHSPHDQNDQDDQDGHQTTGDPTKNGQKKDGQRKDERHPWPRPGHDHRLDVHRTQQSSSPKVVLHPMADRHIRHAIPRRHGSASHASHDYGNLKSRPGIHRDHSNGYHDLACRCDRLAAQTRRPLRQSNRPTQWHGPVKATHAQPQKLRVLRQALREYPRR
jgi:hypothetical protein